MSMFPMGEGLDPSKFSGAILDNDMAVSCLMPMGITSENVATKYGISRQTQDELAVASHKKALEAQKQGLFNEEIVPMTAKVTDAKGNISEVTVSSDEGPRGGTTVSGLGSL